MAGRAKAITATEIKYLIMSLSRQRFAVRRPKVAFFAIGNEIRPQIVNNSVAWIIDGF